MGLGMYGQMLYVSPAAGIVVAKFSSQPRPADDVLVTRTYRALRSLTAHLLGIGTHDRRRARCGAPTKTSRGTTKMKEAMSEMKRHDRAGYSRWDGIGMAPLSEGDLQDIHLATLEVLERTGVWVEADDAIDVFADGGCHVDRETRRVRIPAERWSRRPSARRRR